MVGLGEEHDEIIQVMDDLRAAEVDFLTISRGTLSEEDRQIMENHVSLSYELLDKLPYPEHLKQVPFYAGCHHEKLNGEGYPNGYKNRWCHTRINETSYSSIS